MIRSSLFLLAAVLVTAAQPASPRFDLIVRGATIVDGTGAAPFAGDVGIVGGYIAAIGDLSGQAAPIDLDARGSIVAPGFINLHSHASADALASAENMLTQGVTTEILNADGAGPMDIGAQLTSAEAGGLALNVGANVGFNSAWASVVGEADRRPTAEEIQRMRRLLVENLERGAWGVSSGLDYKPAYFASAEEVGQVVEAARDWRTNFTNHDRLTPEANYSSRAAIAETMAIGERAGLLPIVTHMKVQGREQGTAASVLSMMSRGTRQGQYVAADAYPYLAGQSGLGALIIPGWAQDGGRQQMLARFADPATRRRIVAEAEEAMQARFGGPQGVYLPASKRELTDVMRELDVSAGEAVVRLLESDNMGAILRFGSEADLVRILQHPSTSIACDCGAIAAGRGSHPRFYGTYPRVLGHYVRETRALTLPDAVRKMTLLPAATIGMVDRGAVAVGMAADLVAFDAATVIDRATFDAPAVPSVGIRHVVVNGVVALRDGQVTGARGGRALRRSRHMPSRAMTMDRARRLRVTGTVTVTPGRPAEDVEVALDLAQDVGARTARGTMRIVERQSGRTYAAQALGLLQTAERWATVSARVRDEAHGVERRLLAIVEARDPWIDGRLPSVTLVWEDGPDVSGPIPRGRVDVSP